MPSNKPLIFVVPGAWHLPSIYNTFCAQLQAQGFPTACYQLPSTDLTADPTTASAEEDTALYRKQLLQHLSLGQDIIIVAHSYGAIPGFAAATGLSKKNRSVRGEAVGIIGLIGVAGVVAPEGKSSLNVFQSTIDPNRPPGAPPMTLDVPSPGWAAPTNPAPFLDGVPELLKKAAEQMLGPIASRTMLDSSSKPAWAEEALKGKIAYVHLTRDAAIMPYQQERYRQLTGVEWKIIEMDASHSVFLAKPEELANIVAELAEEFVTAGNLDGRPKLPSYE